jgi:hypothetical protein
LGFDGPESRGSAYVKRIGVWLLGLAVLSGGVALWFVFGHRVASKNVVLTQETSDSNGFSAERTEPLGSSVQSPHAAMLPQAPTLNDPLADDVAAARRLDPDPPRGLVWAKDCQDARQSDPRLAALDPFGLAEIIRRDLHGAEEFPDQVHIVRWEMAFGLPDKGVVLRADWLGTRPARYRVEVQDSRQPRSLWDAAGMAPTEILHPDVTWGDAQQILVSRKQALVAALGAPDYRRVVMTSETDELAAQAVSLGQPRVSDVVAAELQGARVLWFSMGGASCLRDGDAQLQCSCGRGHGHH